eukprot:scpid12615/ scgid22608/ 
MIITRLRMTRKGTSPAMRPMRAPLVSLDDVSMSGCVLGSDVTIIVCEVLPAITIVESVVFSVTDVPVPGQKRTALVLVCFKKEHAALYTAQRFTYNMYLSLLSRLQSAPHVYWTSCVGSCQ